MGSLGKEEALAGMTMLEDRVEPQSPGSSVETACTPSGKQGRTFTQSHSKPLTSVLSSGVVSLSTTGVWGTFFLCVSSAPL